MKSLTHEQRRTAIEERIGMVSGNSFVKDLATRTTFKKLNFTKKFYVNTEQKFTENDT